MEWLFSLAALPLLMCGAMCIGSAVVAWLGIRRRRHRASPPADHRADVADKLVARS